MSPLVQRYPQFILAFIVVFVAWTTHAFGQSTTTDEPEPIEFQPERVTIALHFSDRPALLPADESRVREQTQQMLRRLIGTRWDTTYAPEPLLAQANTKTLRRFTLDDLPVERLAAKEEQLRGYPSDNAPDKIILAVVEPEGIDFTATAREWDRISDSFGPVVTVTANSRGDLPHGITRAITQAYRPVAQIEDKDGVPELRFRGGSLPTPDPTIIAPPSKALFRALLRRYDREGLLADVRPIPYTYLELDKIDWPTASVKSHSALSSALGARRGLVTAWAIAAPLVGDATQLALLRESDGVPLVGRRVDVLPGPVVPGKDPPQPLEELLSDREGVATLLIDREHPLVWVTIRSGTATLMRIPIAPGREERVELELGDDQRRLDAEGRIAILSGELIEIVAKRATLLATARKLARDKKFDEARALLDEADALPAAADFRRRLAAIETPAATAAEKSGERLAAVRIRALGKKTVTLIDRYLTEKPLTDTRDEIAELEKGSKGS